ncbi:hypothetical protein SSX86_006792 [Deinandra increscens subsp. villosa]|uniref:Integrase catalytic domain-containing protein n=1 Tax=Deinandra increscens subsp. villosa TaxID=3103831 RepID=A0AAP0DJE7_9ASTR
MADDTGTSETLVSKLDASNPLYLHASDSSTLTIVSIKLKGTENYTLWANAMKLALQVKNKYGFIDKTCEKSTDNDVLARQWDRCNSVVITWILNSVCDELYMGQVYSKFASDIWTELRETYDKTDGSVLFNLYRQINSCNQNGTSISEYYHKLNILWKQFDQMVQLPSCTCEAATKFNDFNHGIKLMQFLMGLDSVYQPVRTSLLIQDPLPTLKSAFATLSREESHRNSSESKFQFQNSVFVTKSNQFSDNKRKLSRGPNPSLKCTKCNKIGHTVDRCYEIIGYPAWFRSRQSGSGKSNNVNVDKSEFPSAVSSLTSEQVSKLLSLINENPAGDSNYSHIGGMFRNCISSSVFVKPVYNFVSSNNEQSDFGWIIDSGANQHMLMTDKGLINGIDVKNYNITVKHPNGTNARVTKIGDLRLCDEIVLTDVFIVPEYSVNLLSVHKLTKDNKLRIVFDEHKCYVQDWLGKKNLVTGSQVDGLYFCGDTSSCAKVCYSSVLSLNLWHARLGHPSEQVLNVLKTSLGLKFSKADLPCEVCHKAKQHRNPFPLSDHVSKQLGELVHLDVWGPYRVSSTEGFKYFLTIVDDYSRAVWIYLLKGKEEVFENIETFVYFLENQFKKSVKILRSDNGTEFTNNNMKVFCKKMGINHQTSCAYTPQQNGVVERKHRHLLNVSRALMFQSGVPLRMWTECVLTASYLINRTPSSVLNGRSPYELVYGFKPSLNHLRVFGCLCFSTVLNEKDKFSSHADKCILLGYSNQKKGYKLWSLEKHKILFSRDVKFYEDLFPFKFDKDDTILEPGAKARCNSLNFFEVFDNQDSNDGKIPNDEGRVESDTSSGESQVSSGSESAGQVAHGGRESDSSCEGPSSVHGDKTPVQSEGNNSPENVPTSSRRPIRNSVLPVKLKDFVLDGKVKYGFEKVVNYTKLSADVRCFSVSMNKHVEPKNFRQASTDPLWVTAMNDEMEALHRNNTWVLVDLPKGKEDHWV